MIGLEAHQPLADHAQAARRRGLCSLRRLTVVADPELEHVLEADLIRLGATGYTAIPCSGVGKHQLDDPAAKPRPQVRIEVIAPAKECEAMMDHIRRELQPIHRLTFSVETVQVARLDAFVRSGNGQADADASGGVLMKS